ncbi:MFS transporter [Streptomyces yaizuensis]|uniref:MFS transporter n=1 Tax=Streptomyces yaizuensis TaxID=2989713 RepID=A0ABQ5P5A3_9ACTN|nr:MFS transporter [Streptomyces sp. YSPA8]GLF97749.1 MFS transporter [Streptomyces sp. YSPA8]
MNSPSTTTPGPGGGPGPGRLRRLIGTDMLPDLRGNQRIAVALSVDTLGVGLFLPLAFFFFTVTTDLSIRGIGWSMTAATVVALVLSPLGGLLTDRWGARLTVVASNVLTAVGYACYPFADSYGAIFACVFVVMAADRLYFASWPTLIIQISRRDQIDSWFALVQAITAGSVGFGALLSTVFLAQGGVGVLKAVVLLNAALKLIAALLILTARLVTEEAEAPAPGEAGKSGTPAGRWRAILHDRPFRRLLITQLLLASAWAIPASFLPLYLIHTLDLSEWYATLAFALNYLLLFTTQLWITQLVRAYRRTRVMIAGALTLIGSLGFISGASGFEGAVALALVLIGFTCFAVGEMLCSPTASALAAAIAPQDRRGFYMSLFQVTGAIAYGVGPGLVGWLFTTSPLLVPAAVAVCVTVAAVVLRISEPLFPREAQLREAGTDPSPAKAPA